VADNNNSVKLIGHFDVTLDDKNRLILPASFRKIFGDDTLHLTKGEDNNLWLYPSLKWEKLTEEFEELTDPFSSKDRRLLRKLVGSAHEVDIDKSGRILVASNLREYAGLSKDCVVIGQLNYIEIWDKDRFDKYNDSGNEDNRMEEKEASEDMSRRLKNKKGVAV
jgi:MraZ protein